MKQLEKYQSQEVDGDLRLRNESTDIRLVLHVTQDSQEEMSILGSRLRSSSIVSHPVIRVSDLSIRVQYDRSTNLLVFCSLFSMNIARGWNQIDRWRYHSHFVIAAWRLGVLVLLLINLRGVGLRTRKVCRRVRRKTKSSLQRWALS